MDYKYWLNDKQVYSGNPLSWANETVPQILLFICILAGLIWFVNLLRKKWL